MQCLEGVPSFWRYVYQYFFFCCACIPGMKSTMKEILLQLMEEEKVSVVRRTRNERAG